jgi:hypothetical protein
MEQICVTLQNSYLNVVQVLSILSLLKAHRVKLYLFSPEFGKIASNSPMDKNLSSFAKDFNDYFENQPTIITQLSPSIKQYSSFNTDELIESCPQQIIFEIAQHWNDIKESKQWNGAKEIWEYVACPQFRLGDTEPNNKYGFPYQCGECKICHFIEKVVEN